MRTLKRMISQVKIYVRGAENLTWADGDYESALCEAARRMWRHISRNPGAEVLRAFSTPVSATAGGVVALPADCLALEEVQVKIKSAWIPIPYTAPVCGRLAFPPPAEAWTDDVEERSIRIVRGAGTSVRFRYLQEPVFPFDEDGTFRNPDGGDEDAYPGLPELCDSACEHFAAALMSGEELRDEAPIGYHGQQYSAMLGMIAKSRAARPVRRYVRRVR